MFDEAFVNVNNSGFVLVISKFNDVFSNYNVDEAIVNDEISIVNVHKGSDKVYTTVFIADEADG